MLMSTRTRRRLGTRHKGLRLFGDDGIAYILLDNFTDTLAAGSVNGTNATPGPGVRTVTDTNSKLSITGTAASFATGGVGAGDPGLWYPSQARVFGKVVLGRIVVGSTVAAQIGWDANQAAGINDGVRFAAGSGLQVFIAGVGVTVGTYTTTTYDCAVVMRATGMYIYIKGGAFTNWTLLWQSATTSSAMSPAVVANSNAAIFTAANIRVPFSTYIPTPLVYDTFTRADGAIGNSETSGPDAQTTPVLAWTLQDGTIAIVSNKASLTVLGGDLLGIATVTAPSADVMIDCNLVRTLGSAGIVARYADASNYLRATTDGTNVLCEQVVAGTPTTLRTAVTTYSAGNTLRLSLSGTTGWLFYNGAAVGASFTVPSSVVTNHGLYGSDLSATWDNFQIFARDTVYEGLSAL